ncbi:protein angel homolog 2 isoform X2 [Halichoeres trimaculatus]|uniref:protein angel homolog 2 isoform X2 n=1 Tax=Halichoeres trimaculatus TaxID=147232 RepID=UPI003D9EE547
MQPRRHLTNVHPGQEHHMFLRQLSSSVLPGCRPTFCRVGFRSSTAFPSYPPPHLPTPPPWWSAQRFPPQPPRLPVPYLAAHQVHSGRLVHPQSVTSGNFGGGGRSFYTSTGFRMEQHDRDRGPPYKRRKSVEVKRSSEGQEGGVTGGKAQDWGSKKEHHAHSHQHERLKDGSRDRGRNGDGNRASRENCIDKGRTKSWDKNKQHKDSANPQETQSRERSTHQQPGLRDSHADSKTQATKSKPDRERTPTHKPNHWFKERREEVQAGSERSSRGPERLFSDKRRTSLSPNPRQEAGAKKEPPPPGTDSPEQPQGEEPIQPLQRHWEFSPACSIYPEPPGCSAPFDFSVMSYNILSQDLLLDNSYLYRHCDPNVLPWARRLPNLLMEILQHDADILCLQEVQEDHYEKQIKPALQARGYQCEYKKRTGCKPDGCAIIFKTSRLSLLSSNPVEYFRPGDTLLDRDNVGLVLLLRPNNSENQSDPSFICVANTHLLYNPRRGDIKLAQLAILLAEINRVTRRSDGSSNPVVLCGDFNSTPLSPLYNLLTTGCLEYTGMPIGMVSGQESIPRGQRLLTPPIWSQSLGINQQCRYNKPVASSPTVEGAISNLTVEDFATTAAFPRARIEHGLKLQSSYQHCLPPDGRPEITTCHSRTAMTVDYILYTPEFIAPPPFPAERGLQLLGRLSLVGKSELDEVNGLPNQHHSSDHLPLLARFRLRR